jgi:hypothetical protein
MLTRVINRPTAAVVTVLMAAGPAAVPLQGSAAADEQESEAVHGWTVALNRSALSRKGQLVRSRRTFETVGVTWARGADPGVEVRTLTGGTWSPWQEADELTLARNPATEPLWVDASEAVRVRVAEWRKGLEVVMVDPGEAAEQQEAPTSARMSSTAVTTKVARKRLRHAPMPRLRLREDWGADEKLRDGDPVYLDGIKMAHVHHTAGKNGYTRAEVPGIIRSMYWYHTKQLGWSDIGYNFLVDRFGRIWVGRAGGYRKRVRGAHTLGFNHASFGVAAIGDFDEMRANERVKGALTRLVAWKLDREGRDPAGRVTIWSKGSDRYAEGTRLRLPAILSHRRTNETACPGASLYRFVPRLRERAQSRADDWN